MKKILKEYGIQIIIFIIFLFLTFYKLPYMVLEPGGIDDISKRYIIESGHKINGSINLSYVNEVRPNAAYFLYAKLKKYKIEKLKKDEVDNLDFVRKIERLMYESSISNAIYVAYNKAGKKIDISNLKQYIYYNVNESSPLKMGDLLVSINDIPIDQIDSIKNIINEASDTVTIKYIRDDKEYSKKVKIMDVNGEKKLGVLLISIFDYETDPVIKFKNVKNAFGPSAGSMIALSIYCSLIDEDLTKGLKISGTGEIFADGMIGPIGGIEEKVRGAAKKKVDVFFVPTDNYDDAKSAKKKYHLNIKLVKVSTFDDIINYLESN